MTTPELVDEMGRRRFPTSMGHMTGRIQKGYIEWKSNTKLPQDGFAIRSGDSFSLSLSASFDDRDTLYFWQLYSLLGRKPLRDLSTIFYTNVFDESEEEWFRESFGSPNITNHAMFFSLVLMDCFGGGSMYAGGEVRLDDVHKTGASHVMNHAAAIKWSKHMRNALNKMQASFDECDPRVRPALNEFFTFFMVRYSVMFEFSMEGVFFEEQ